MIDHHSLFMGLKTDFSSKSVILLINYFVPVNFALEAFAEVLFSLALESLEITKNGLDLFNTNC